MRIIDEFVFRRKHAMRVLRSEPAIRRALRPTRCLYDDVVVVIWEATAALNDVFMSPTTRAVSMNCFARHPKPTRIFLYVLVSIVWPAMASIQSLTKWTKCESRDCTGSRFATEW
jgi:hypothetical protein